MSFNHLPITCGGKVRINRVEPRDCTSTLAPNFGREFLFTPFRRIIAASPIPRWKLEVEGTKEKSMSNQLEERYEDSQLYRIRHSAAHVMAQAVLEFYPETKFTIGPPIENGFYYDFDFPQPLVLEDLEKIEKRMRQIIAGGHHFIKKVVTADEARQVFIN